MIEAYAVEDVRSSEREAMAALPEGELMSRAARGLAAVVAARLEERGGSRVVGLVGGGNNGGDALYALADLAERGYAAAAVLAAEVHQGGLEAARQAGVVLVAGDAQPGRISSPASAPAEKPQVSEPSEASETSERSELAGASDGDDRSGSTGWREVLREADVVVDGILGIGGRPGLREPAESWAAAIPDGAWVVAVDLPSGADPAGEVPAGPGIFADETVTFGVAKPVHLMPGTERAVGRLTVVDIGLDVSAYRPAVQRLTFDDVARLWPVPGPASDKYARGVVGIVAGTPDYPGAAVLSVLGSLGAGPGMIRYVGPPEVGALVHAAAPEVVTAEGRVQAWVLGSGFDPSSRAKGVAEQRRHVEEALASDLPALVDAGALELIDHRDAPTLLTPHAGELARLLTRLGAGPDGREVSREDVTASPLAHARAAAERTGATVLLKGSHTLVVSPDRSRPVRSQADAPAWLATAGAGDVLGGLVGTLLAAGLDPLDAGALGALVHGVAADRCNPGGPVRITGVAREIPATVAHLLRYR